MPPVKGGGREDGGREGGREGRGREGGMEDTEGGREGGRTETERGMRSGEGREKGRKKRTEGKVGRRGEERGEKEGDDAMFPIPPVPTHISKLHVHLCLLISVQEPHDLCDAPEVPRRPLGPVTQLAVLLRSTGVECAAGGQHGTVVVTGSHLQGGRGDKR